jgi:BirA family biotin operon repressor/biotin-[acetyl-CoA-carboxylase] ligase
LQRRWVSAPGAGLAFSLILLSPSLRTNQFSLLPGLGALATCLALQHHFSLPAQIKWPNDILLDGRKTAGVLAEARWHGDELTAAVIGIGINIALQSINPQVLHPETLDFPATCIEKTLGHPVERWEVLHAVLSEFLGWLPRLSSAQFLQTWESNLAYMGMWVELSPGNVSPAQRQDASSPDKIIGRVNGLAADGSLQLSARSGEGFSVHAGEIHLRPTG